MNEETLVQVLGAIQKAEHWKAFPREVREIVEAVFRCQDGVEWKLDVAFAQKVLAIAKEAEVLAKTLWAGHLKGEVKVAHTVEVDRTYNRSNAWVVSPDGSLRKEDENSFKRSKKFTDMRGSMEWDLIDSAELALYWGGDYRGHAFTVCFQYLPPTDAQRATVARLEDEIQANFPDAPIGRGWGLRPGAKPLPSAERIYARILAEAAELRCEKDPFSTTPTWAALCDRCGVSVCSEPPATIDHVRVIATEMWEGGVRKVEAQILRRVACETGVIEFLYFKKYGKMNLSARWREARDGDPIEAPITVATPVVTNTAPQAPAVSPQPVAKADAEFRHGGKRKFPCPSCGQKLELSVGKFQDVQRGTLVTLTCPCGTKGVAKM